MRKRFPYILDYRYEIDPAFGREAETFKQRAKAYFRKMTRRKLSEKRLCSDAEKLSQKCRSVYAQWLGGKDDRDACDNYIRDMIDYVNRFIYYRYITEKRDFMPDVVLGLLLRTQMLSDLNSIENEYRLKVRKMLFELIAHLLNVGDKGIYVFGYEV